MKKYKKNTQFVFSFKNIDKINDNLFGGKGKSLAKLYNLGYPVPEGFVISSFSFKKNKIIDEAWSQIKTKLKKLRNKYKNVSFAVRSSGLSEDSESASFAGEFESVIDVKTDEKIKKAIYKVYNSKNKQRIKLYCKKLKIENKQKIAIIVQILIEPDYSGVIFTQDPISCKKDIILGNFVKGLGEKLVSGKVNTASFRIDKRTKRYDGPICFKKHSKKLIKISKKIEKDLKFPQDIEFAIKNNKIYILQSRPITTLITRNKKNGEINESLDCNNLWVGIRRKECIPGVMTPSTWSIWDPKIKKPNKKATIANICGRFYDNATPFYSKIKKIEGEKIARKKLNERFGEIPKDFEIPEIKISKIGIYYKKYYNLIKWLILYILRIKRLKKYISSIQARYYKLYEKIEKIEDMSELLKIWPDVYKNLEKSFSFRFIVNVKPRILKNSLNRKLKKHFTQEEIDHVLTNVVLLYAQNPSTNQLLDFEKTANNEMDFDEYINKYGYLGSAEWQLYPPRFKDEPDIIKKQIKDYKKSNLNIMATITKKIDKYNMIWSKFEKNNPKKAKKLQRRLIKYALYVQYKLEVHLAVTKSISLIRDFYQKAGKITGLKNDIFFLTYIEMIDMLAGKKEAVSYIEERKKTYEKYKKIPTLPGIINGRFNINKWISDYKKNSEIYDSYSNKKIILKNNNDLTSIKGECGSPGTVIGKVKILTSPKQISKLKKGEILVTTTTNIAWMNIYIKAKGIITDIGGALAHASIIARELGIPAVVGCKVATKKLKNGDRVRLNGTLGTIEILD